MTRRDPQHAPPSRVDGDGVRIVEHRSGRIRGTALYRALAVALIALCAGALWRLHGPSPPPGGDGAQIAASTQADADPDDGKTRSDRERGAPAPLPGRTFRATPAAPEPPAGDLADYYVPGDPVPTGAEVIKRLNDAGIRTGIGAFPPPGTSPPLIGLAVPEDFELPEGFVRHYQATDDGQRIEPILMFSPDYAFFDASGRPIAIPSDRVVPPELAPQGLMVRRIRIPPPLPSGSPRI